MSWLFGTPPPEPLRGPESPLVKSDATTLVGHNHFASLIMVHLAPSAEVEFGDDTRPPSRVVIKKIDKELGREGDTVVAVGGRALQKRHTATEVTRMARDNTQQVDMLLWGLRGSRAKRSGVEIRIHCKNLDLDLGEVVPPPHIIDHGTIIVVIDASAAKLQRLREQGIERGDVLIGVNYEPIRDDEPPKFVKKRLDDHLLLGPIVLNLWRCTDVSGHADLQKKATRAARISASKLPGLQGTTARLQLQGDACIDGCGALIGCVFHDSSEPFSSQPPGSPLFHDHHSSAQ